MKANSIPTSLFSTCNRSREIWSQLNELRGLFTAASRLEYKLESLWQRFGKLRDDLAMHYAHEWGGAGALRQATLKGSVSREKLSLFLEEQTQIYSMVSDLTAEVEDLVRSHDVSANEIRKVVKHFKVFDALLISHESRKSMALHDN